VRGVTNDDNRKQSEVSAFGALLKEVAKAPEEASISSPPMGDLLGTTLHQYHVLAMLGYGGMGVVYRAQDTRLGRHVALKVLSPALSDDAAGRQRFLREARSAGALAHPNIAAVYEVEEAAGRVFLVMELIEGQTLRAKLRDGPLPVAEAVRIAKAIARGLAKAHDKGMVHRDLKPENVMLTREGDVKILDFGLAKLSATPASRTEFENQATDMAVTEEGVVLGTLGYMSPEQASGTPVDARADLFALGIVLYEMVTGSLPFAGRTRSEILATLLRDEPIAPSKRAPSVGPELERAILRCLRKKVEDRPASAEDVLTALEGGAAAPRRAWAGVALAATAAAVLAGAVIVLAVRRSAPPTSPAEKPAPAQPAPTVTRLIDLPPPRTLVPAAAAAFTSGMQAVHDDNWFKALGLFAEAARLDPKMPEAHLYLSLASVIMNDPAGRHAEYEKAAGLRATLSERDRALLEALQPLLQSATQDIGEADRRLRALTERYPNDAELWMLLGFVHYGTSATSAPAERALELDRDDGQSWENKGHGALMLGRLADARAAYARCGSLTIDGADCFAWAGISYALEGRCDEYERELRRASDRNPLWDIGLIWAMVSSGRSAATIKETETQAMAALPPPLNAPYIGAGIDVRLAIVAGDFTRAASLAKRESKLLEADAELSASYAAHYDLAGALLEIAQETGDDDAVRRVASDFLSHADAWPIEAVFGHAVDLSLDYARVALPTGVAPPADFEARRTAWIHRALFAGADPAQVWVYGYASPALTAVEARAALAALPEWGSPSPTPSNFDSFFGRVGSPEADLGRVYLLAGQVDESIGHLKRAVASCDLFTSTIDHLRAARDLGIALAQKGETTAACEAYGVVLSRWGQARPRSVTADDARARARALGCAAR
jgi:tRNA A-37 threonylcarbamoyl transferase component Bud32/tetratricopeptide (TPR) repeat protein